ncbi:unnamed protein product [Paramecium primaurelia]|uniref:Uncharacterized protein n=1 Tax=Paramecium primaurelia TaxID=5886 RepID=A0A8S1QTN6_PARPR|nr:unnamed protein product [Paramecium primaurelia]
MKMNKIELLTILSNVIPVTIFTLFNILCDDDFQTSLKLNKQIDIGFVQIGWLIFSLIGPFLKIYLTVIIYGNNLNKEKQQ